ncbi:MAG: DUF4349 domain-containing protein [Acidimicrobiia bacterium]|nr:DUF4349 domain-containing protein [Acidimicrobiia bacterium]
MRRTLFVFLALALVLAACGSASDTADFATDDFSGRVDSPGEAEAPAADAPMDDVASDGDSSGVPLAAQATGDAVVGLNRDIIYTASVAISVEDVASAADAAVEAIGGLGGFVFGQETTGAPEARTILTFKVPPERFQDALDALAGIGELRSQSISADDVTERIVDIESQIQTTEVSVERLRELLASTTNLEDIAEIETQLLERETRLERLRGQLRTLEDAVSLATITLVIQESFSAPGLSVDLTAYPDSDATGASCPGDGDVTVPEGDDITLCIEMTNTGDTLLTDFALTDTVLDISLDDLTVVYGELDRPMEPGESVMLSTVVEVERSIQTRTRVTATPTNDDGEALAGRSVQRTEGIYLDGLRLQRIPSFLDGFEGSLRLMVQLWNGLLLALGAVLPFVVVIGIVGFAVRPLWRRRKDATADEAPEPITVPEDE